MNNKISLTLKSDFNQFSKISDFLEKYARENSISSKTIFQITLSIEEIFNNIISYGYKGETDQKIDFHFSVDNKILTIAVEDSADFFNPLKAANPDLTNPLEKRVPGGLGIHFVRRLMDRVTYKRENNKNIITLVKNLAGNSEGKTGVKNGN